LKKKMDGSAVDYLQAPNTTERQFLVIDVVKSKPEFQRKTIYTNIYLAHNTNEILIKWDDVANKVTGYMIDGEVIEDEKSK
jgi:hypothetical protein